MYDLLSHIYTDAVVQKCHTKDENRAFCDMVDRTDGRPAIFIADRGYESFNNMAHVQEKGCFFLIRIKDNAGGIGCGLDLPDTDTFDKSFSLSLTRKQTNEMKETVKNGMITDSFAAARLLIISLSKTEKAFLYRLMFCPFVLYGSRSPTTITKLLSQIWTPVLSLRQN